LPLRPERESRLQAGRGTESTIAGNTGGSAECAVVAGVDALMVSTAATMGACRKREIVWVMARATLWPEGRGAHLTREVGRSRNK
jgi:hypothetical protein